RDGTNSSDPGLPEREVLSKIIFVSCLQPYTTAVSASSAAGPVIRHALRKSELASCSAILTVSVRRRCAERPLLGGQHCVDALLLHQDHDELCWLRRARVAPDRVHVVWAFVESLSWCQRDLLAALDPFDDRPFQHIDEGVCIVPMDVL